VAEPKRISRIRKPEEMSLEAWQVALRRQFAQEQKFRVNNIGAEPVFSEFRVTNPQTGKTYRVAVRGERLGDNYCSCPDFATNTLGTCKHVEFTLAKLRRRRGAKAAGALVHSLWLTGQVRTRFLEKEAAIITETQQRNEKSQGTM
jgi:hypothetical protein